MGSNFKLNLNTDRFEHDMEKKLRANLETAAKEAVKRAKDIVPVDTGRLKASIGYKIVENGDTLEAEIYADAPYAMYVEMGTHKMKAEPFLRPAVFGHGSDILREVTGK